MFLSMLRVAAVAGLPAALALTLVQALWVTPLILQAETYENNALALTMHERVETGAQDRNIWPRTAGTAMANAAMGLGYGLILSGLYLFAAHPDCYTARYGVWRDMPCFLLRPAWDCYPIYPVPKPPN